MLGLLQTTHLVLLEVILLKQLGLLNLGELLLRFSSFFLFYLLDFSHSRIANDESFEVVNWELLLWIAIAFHWRFSPFNLFIKR